MFIRTERSVREFIYAYPIVTSLVIINIVLWLIIYVLPFTFGKYIYMYGVGHNLSVYAAHEYWRLVTPIFLHSRDLTHVLFNSFSLVLFGPALEQMLGRMKFIIAYVIMGLAGNIGTFIVNPVSMNFHIGASGAIYGLFGIYIFIIFFRQSLIDRMNAQIVLTIFVIGLVMTFITPRINIAGHIFGFIGGFLIAPLFLIGAQPFSIYRNPTPPPRKQAGGAQFDPNRWEKRKIIPEFIRENKAWVIFIIIVLLIYISQL